VKARALIVKYIDEKTAHKFFGPAIGRISLPEIPKIDRDTKSMKAFEKSQRKSIKISPQDKQKYDYLFIKELFSVVRKSPASEDDISQWMNVLSQGSSREGIYRGLVLDNEYASYENYGASPSDNLIEFSARYLSLYTAKKVRKSSLQAINLYTIKRILVERSLDVFDSFPQDNDDLYDWYAVLSVDLADRFSRVWKNQLRRDSSLKRHKNWAKSVPIQFLKSELIIKLHKACNSFSS